MAGLYNTNSRRFVSSLMSIINTMPSLSHDGKAVSPPNPLVSYTRQPLMAHEGFSGRFAVETFV